MWTWGRGNRGVEKSKAYTGLCGYIEDIYFFEVNTKYISSNVLKIIIRNFTSA